MRSFNSIGIAGPARPVPRTLRPTLSVTARRRLDQWGYVLVEGVESSTAAEELVRSVGDLIPQYNGLLTHEVTYRPGSKDRSQSANVTSARTEAPGRHPSPAYLALFCHRQARCGGGHTDLLDIRRRAALVATLAILGRRCAVTDLERLADEVAPAAVEVPFSRVFAP